MAITPDGATDPELLLDAGTGIREVTRLLVGRACHGTIALTHWDDTQGLPSFGGGDRDDAWARLLLPTSGAGGEPVAALQRAMTPPTFPITPRQLRGDWTFGLDPGLVWLGPFTLMARQIPHTGGRTFGYRSATAARRSPTRPITIRPSSGPVRTAGASTPTLRRSWRLAWTSSRTTRSEEFDLTRMDAVVGALPAGCAVVVIGVVA